MVRDLIQVVAVLALVLPPASRAQQVVVPTFQIGGPLVGDHVGEVEVAPRGDGAFLVVWGDYTSGGGVGASDHATARLMSADGLPLAPPRQIDTSGHVFALTVSPDGLGGFAAAWQWISNEYLFFAQRLDEQGVPRGPDFEMTLNLAGYPVTVGTVIGTSQGPVFLWDENGFWARGLDAGGVRRGGDIRVGDGAYKTDVAAFPSGGFVLTWYELFETAPSRGRVFDAEGNPSGPEFDLGEGLVEPRVATSPRGGFAVAGLRASADGTATEVWARRFEDDGTPGGPAFFVSQGALQAFVGTDVAFDDRGNLYVAWAECCSITKPVRARVFDGDGVPLGAAVDVGDGPAAHVRVERLAGGTLVNVWNRLNKAVGSIVRVCEPASAVCGDGVRAAACEECDDGAGNGNGPDACRPDCRRARCGDGVLDTGEACDDGNDAACDGCSPGCAVEPGVVCGDGVRNQACGEECDEGGGNGTLPNGCRADCRLARCGDGVVDDGEACDDGNGAPCDGCAFDCTVEAEAPAVCAPQPLPRASAADLARFARGLEEFLQTENVATGLGPVFNGTRCAECHNVPTVGGSSNRNVTRIAAGSGSTFDPLESVGGPLLQANGISTGTCSVAGETVPPEATVVAERNAPALFGLGLIEAIPDLSIRLMKERQRAPISGRFNVNRTTNRIGRLGWKAQIATIHDFAAEAYRDEMGITSPFATTEAAPQGVPTSCDGAPEVEDDGGDVAAFADFMTLLAPLPQGPVTSESRRGRRYFRRLKCHVCHTDKYRTALNFPVPALRGLRVPLFSDLLLHDMGPGLADGIEQEAASGREFRTAPLWGVRFSAPYLHDGRAATLEEAILAHDGEALNSAVGFQNLDPVARAAVVAYLNSL
jgi:cysteine-rich repeat protein